LSQYRKNASFYHYFWGAIWQTSGKMNIDSGEEYPSQADLVTVKGTVKWFNTAKGFGFISPSDGSRDVFLHLSCLRDAGFETVDEGAAIVCEAVQRPKGLQAVKILQLDQAAGAKNANSRPLRSGPRYAPGGAKFPPVTPEGDFLDARVKWFNPMKGFGFVSSGSAQQDIFIHMEVLRRSGIGDLQPGQPVRIRIGQGPKGPQVAEIELA
jgi:CspA family cold shock protein